MLDFSSHPSRTSVVCVKVVWQCVWSIWVLSLESHCGLREGRGRQLWGEDRKSVAAGLMTCLCAGGAVY